MKTRGLAIVVAFLLAGVATAAVFMYVRGVRSQSEAQEVMVPVVVSKEDIPPGTPLDALLAGGKFTTTTVPQTALIRGVVTTLEQLQGQQTSSPILAGEQISTARLRGEAEFGGGILGIPEGHKAITLPLDVPRAIGTVLRKGDHVSVYSTFEAAGGGAEATVTVVPDVLILEVFGGAVDPNTGTAVAPATSGSILVAMALEPRDAQRVVYAMERGSVWLGLLPPNEVGQPEPPVTIGEVIE